jgi:hypothetical protein
MRDVMPTQEIEAKSIRARLSLMPARFAFAAHPLFESA